MALLELGFSTPAHGWTFPTPIQHVVFLIQENCSFDRYFGTLRGVRGFGDPRTGESPYALWPAFDVVAQAMGGAVSATGAPIISAAAAASPALSTVAPLGSVMP